MIKAMIKRVISSLTCIYCRRRYKMHIDMSSVLFPRFEGVLQSNNIGIDNAIFQHCSLSIQGYNNTVTLSGLMQNTKMEIYGNNNQLIFKNKCEFHNSNIIIRGDNCIVTVGEGTRFGSVYMVCMGQGNSISIGQDCMFADQVDIWNTDSHPLVDLKREIINPSRPICIENHVWIGKGGKILKGVKIGSNAVIGMNSLVTKDINPNTLNVGSPTKCIKEGINWSRDFISV